MNSDIMISGRIGSAVNLCLRQLPTKDGKLNAQSQELGKKFSHSFSIKFESFDAATLRINSKRAINHLTRLQFNRCSLCMSYDLPVRIYSQPRLFTLFVKDYHSNLSYNIHRFSIICCFFVLPLSNSKQVPLLPFL